MAERKTYTAEDFKGCNGRRVLVEGVIETAEIDEDGDLCVQFVGNSQRTVTAQAYIDPSAIVEILPEEIKTGDRVMTNHGSEVTVVTIVDDGERIALIKYADGSYDCRPLSDLTLVECGQ